MKRMDWRSALPTLCLLLSLSSCRGSNSAQPAFLSAMTPKAGGMTLPTALPAQPADGDITSHVAHATRLQVGQLVVVVNPDGLKLQGDATVGSEVRGLYPAGATLTVLEPSGGYTLYPVQNDNHDWYRFQAADGLVGWAMIEAIVPADRAPVVTATPAG